MEGNPSILLGVLATHSLTHIRFAHRSSHNYGTPNGASNVSPASSAKAPKFRTESVDSVTNWASEKSYEVTELCTKFLGWRHKVLYQVSLLALMYVGLLAYSQVFANR